MVDFMLKQEDSSPFVAAILSFCFSSSALNLSASLTILSISSLERRPWSLVMVILLCLFVDLSTADTLRIPLASIKGDLNLWNPTRRGRDSGEVKLAKEV